MVSSEPRQSNQKQLIGSLQIEKVEGKRTVKDFIHLPWSLYLDDPVWVPPLKLERRIHLSAKNPYFEHAKYCSWLVYRNSQPVGRISAQIDRLYLDRYQNATGFFGMLEAENHGPIFGQLLETAEAWLRKRGMRRISGPYNLSINQELGLLVDGFDAPPSIMMGHARPYYASQMEKNGYRKEKDLLAYVIDTSFRESAAMKTMAAKAKKRIQIRTLRKSQFERELQVIRDIFNDAWSQNWGFIPWTELEFKQLAKDLKPLVDEELVVIAEVDGQPAAFIVVLPNINEIIKDLNGRLFPLGWLKILWRLKVKHPKSARIPLMGVRSRYHHSLLGAALAFAVITGILKPAMKRGLEEIELSWILEDNTAMRSIVESIRGRVYKTYRIYTKDLA